MRFTKEFCFAPVCSKFRVLILRHLIATISKYCRVFPVYAMKFFFFEFPVAYRKAATRQQPKRCLRQRLQIGNRKLIIFYIVLSTITFLQFNRLRVHFHAVITMCYLKQTIQKVVSE